MTDTKRKSSEPPTTIGDLAAVLMMMNVELRAQYRGGKAHVWLVPLEKPGDVEYASHAELDDAIRMVIARKLERSR